MKKKKIKKEINMKKDVKKTFKGFKKSKHVVRLDAQIIAHVEEYGEVMIKTDDAIYKVVKIKSLPQAVMKKKKSLIALQKLLIEQKIFSAKIRAANQLQKSEFYLKLMKQL